MGVVFQPIAPRPAPVKTEGFVPWVRANLFGDWKSSIATLAIVALVAGGGLMAWSAQMEIQREKEARALLALAKEALLL
ncbi:MAG: hypothetical protein N3D71_01205, partial [Burkholderiaceae bacterium]|nr:hypothetical protein [Burkholderiaceae bacterium]